MLKKRLIFILLYQNNNFYLSRNFNIQKIGNFNWLNKNYNFSQITKTVDEIMILDISRKKQDLEHFLKILKKFTKNCFIPLAAGGKIDTLEKAKLYIDSGADKIVINSKLFNQEFIKSLSQVFGEQCLVGSIDYKIINKKIYFFIKNGKKKINLSFKEVLIKIKSLPVGEIMFNSIDRDGTGFGYDFTILQNIPLNFPKQIIFSGGAGNYTHLVEALKKKQIDSVATSNLVNFVGDGLQEARNLISKTGIKVAEWQDF